MAKEHLEDRSLTGKINIACKYDDGTVRYWETDKELVVKRIIHIVNKYNNDGYTLTLRQLHYQFVANNWIVNHDTAYKKLGSILDDCRYSGVVDWAAFEDRGRRPYIPLDAEDLPAWLNIVKNQYRLDRQSGQTNYIELWTEKDALSGIFKVSTEKYHIQLVVNKGYTSSSAIYEAYKRIAPQILQAKKVTILYFGDHDPSGLDMVRDIKERLLFFLCRGNKFDYYSDFFNSVLTPWWEKNQYSIYTLNNAGYLSNKIVAELLDLDEPSAKSIKALETAQVHMYLDENDLFEVKHIGLTVDQINHYNLPANPTKLTDKRTSGYILKYGKQCWEVDALEPDVLTRLVSAEIEKLLDMDKYNKVIDFEERDKLKIEDIINRIDYETR